MIQTRVCQDCGGQDTDAWIDDGKMLKCKNCGVTKVAGPSSCRQCGASEEHFCVLSYVGCCSCRPEAQLRGRVRQGPAASVLARSAMAFAILYPMAMGLHSSSGGTNDQRGVKGASKPRGGRAQVPGRVRKMLVVLGRRGSGKRAWGNCER